MSGIQQLLLGGPFGAGAQGDPNWQNVTLLSGTTTTNTGQNNTFLDSSGNGLNPTRNGNTTQGTFSPFSQANGYWSNFFNGSSDKLNIADSTDFTFTGAFTVECWVYFNNTNYTYGCVLGGHDGTSATWGMYIKDSNNYASFFVNGTLVETTTAVTRNQWVHIAATRDGSNVCRVFINGTNGTTSPTVSGTIETPSGGLNIGRDLDTNGYFGGYISNIRIVKGTALYTSNFTPSTSPLTTTSQGATASEVMLLTCQSNRFIDNSTQNTKTVTVSAGTPSVQAFQPFGAPIIPYSASTIGGSGYFDGTGDSLSLTTNSSFVISGDFTVEFWAYFTATGTYQPLLDQYTAAGFLFRVSPGSTINGDWYINSTSGSDGIGSFSGTACPINAWNFFRLIRSGSTVTVYCNGVSVGTRTRTGNVFANSSTLNIANYSTNYFTGYLSGLRIVPTALTGTEIPTTPPTVLSNTRLLLNYTNANIYDQAVNSDFETIGNTQVSTSVKKYGDSSMAFDGAGDTLQTKASNQNLNVGSGEFTVEGWVYFNNTSQGGLFQASNTVGGFAPNQTNNLALQRESSTAWQVYWNNTFTSTGAMTISTSTWYHFAMNRSGSTSKLYINGNQVLSTSDTTTYNTPYIGFGGIYDASSYILNGNMSDVRITKGLGRYPYNFTPPTTSLPNFYQAQTLTADPYFEYTTLLLPGSGTNLSNNNAFLDSSGNGFNPTRNGNTTQGTFSPFSQTGWSNYFDGTGDNFTVPNSSNFAFGTGDFTIECWVYWSYTQYNAIVSTSTTAQNSGSWILGYSNTANSMGFCYDVPGFNFIEANFSGFHNQWTHVAVTRSGTSLRLFFNGTQVASATNSTNFSYTSGNVKIGQRWSDQDAYTTTGYLSNLRVVKGTAVYTSNFTPPTTPLSDISGTSLLFATSNRFRDASSNALAVTIGGNPSVQAFSPFNPTAAYSAATNGGSGYFDGTGDYLSTSTSQIIPTGSFTIEAWVYTTQAIATAKNIVSQGTGGDSNRVAVSIESSKWWFQMGSDVVNLGTPVLGQWNYVAMTFNGSTIQGYVNGVSQGTASHTGNAQNTTLSIGSEWLNQYWNGYISSVRISNTVRTVTTVPTTPFTTDANTRFLCNFTNAGVTDATAKNDLETVADAQISNTTAKWGSTSIKFDGTGDYLVAPSSPITSLEGDFTVEFWVYRVAGNNFFFTLGDSQLSTGFDIYIGTSGTVLNFFSNNAARITATPFAATTWSHLAVARYGSTVTMYINGVSAGTWSSSATFSGRVFVGAEFYGGSVTGVCNGYMQDVRITKGIARYTQNFPVPTAAFQLL